MPMMIVSPGPRSGTRNPERWRRRKSARAGTGGLRRFGRFSPLKPGRPPGWQRKPTHEVHEVLDVLHGLAQWALEPPDTS
jgi:hypothetical protein